MFLEVGDLLASYYYVIDTETKERIHLVQWADDKKGIYEKLVADKNGMLVGHYDKINNEWIMDKEVIHRNIKLVGRNWFFRLLKLFLK